MTIYMYFMGVYGERYFYNPHDVRRIVDFDDFVNEYLDPTEIYELVTDRDKEMLGDRFNDYLVPTKELWDKSTTV